MQWLNRIGHQLERFRWIRNEVGNCRCPYCHDSDISKRKARGYFYPDKKEDELRYFCHNCPASGSFSFFLLEHFPEEHKEYKLEKFKDSVSHSSERKGIDAIPDAEQIRETERYKTNTREKLSSSISKSINLKWCDRLDKLPNNHAAVKYCRNRLIPKSTFGKIYSTPNFREFVHSNWPHMKDVHKKLPEDARIIFLLKKSDGEIFGFQGRSITGNGLRYITIKINEDVPYKLFGLERLDKSKTHLVLEGAIDSLFLPNSIALCGGDIGSSLDHVDEDRAIYVLDNEPRSRDTLARMEVAIDAGAHVAFFPDKEYHGLKDINTMIEAGIDRKKILQTILSSTKHGLAAKMELSNWRKI